MFFSRHSCLFPGLAVLLLTQSFAQQDFYCFSPNLLLSLLDYSPFISPARPLFDELIAELLEGEALQE